ncbi:MAG: hypothetical protein U0R52_00660 [Solirubrobacterales bacterium]
MEPSNHRYPNSLNSGDTHGWVNRSTSVWMGVAAAALAALALGVPAAGAGTVKFGSKLNPSIQPSNSLPARDCRHQNPGQSCTFVQNEAYGRPNGGEKAPAGGTLKRVRVIAGGKGHFRLQIVRAHRENGTWKAKVVHVGPVIRYQGQKQSNFNSDRYRVEAFGVNIPISKGDRLAMRATKTSAIRCSGGGDSTLIFQPPLLAGAGFVPAVSTDGCFMLIEGVIRK